MKKKIFLISLIALCMCGCGKVSKLSDGTDAVVSFEGMESISVDSLYDNMKDRYAVSILIDMIDKEILFEEYKDEIEDAEDYADEQVKTLQNSYDSEEELLNAINSYYGYQTMKEFKEYIELNYFRDLATTDYAKKQITDKEIESYYESDIVGDIEASHILITVDVKDDATDEEKEKAENKAKKEAEQIIEKLNNGEDFETLAKKYSADSSSQDGGNVGWFNRDEMVEQFEEAAIKLKVGEYTKTPVETKYGYHIILKTDSKEKPELSKVKDTIIETLADEKLEKDTTLQTKALVSLREKAEIKIEDDELARQYKNYINNLLNS